MLVGSSVLLYAVAVFVLLLFLCEDVQVMCGVLLHVVEDFGVWQVCCGVVVLVLEGVVVLLSVCNEMLVGRGVLSCVV